MTHIILKENFSHYHQVITYPDGQRTVQLHLDKLSVKEPVDISCRIKNFYELEIFLCLVSALLKNDFCVTKVNYIYLFGQRSDRAFEPGQPNYQEVLSPILNRLKIQKRKIFFPHSFKTIDADGIDAPIIDIIHKIQEYLNDTVITIAGDESSKILSPISLYFKKKRGKENSVEVSLDEKQLERLKGKENKWPELPILIVDDLCDGGATFIAESKYLRQQGIKNDLYLFVAHGLFTRGLEELSRHFKRIFCTNSYQDISHPNVTQFEVI